MKRTIIYFFRNLKQRKVTSVVTIGGFAISLAVIFILVTFIINEKSYNRTYTNYSNLYRVKRENSAQLPERVIEEIRNIPGIERACKYHKGGAVYTDGNSKKTAVFFGVDTDFLSMFDISFIYGGIQNSTFSKNKEIILTESLSKNLFGDLDPSGKVVKLEHSGEWVVIGVINDPPEKSSFSYEGVVSIENSFGSSKYGYQHETYNLINSFVLINPNSDLERINQQLSGLLSKHKPFKDDKLSVHPFSEVYFDYQTRNDGLITANVQIIQLLIWIAIIILVVSVINYVNLSLAAGNDRLKEICIKKTNGAGRFSIFRQLIAEAILTSTISMILGLFIAILISPLFFDILGKEINLVDMLGKKEVNLMLFSLVIFVGLAIGIYPAWITSRHTPVTIIQKTNRIGGVGFRSGLTVFQFVISTALIICLLFLQKQIEYIKYKDVGFDTEQLISLKLKGGKTSNALKNKLLSNPKILNVSGTSGTILNIYGQSSGTLNGIKVDNVSGLHADTSFLSTYGVKLIKGRNFRVSDQNACIINEHMYKKLEYEDILGQKIFGRNLIGVTEDFHFEGMYKPIGNIMISSIPEENQAYVSHLTIRIMGSDMSETLDYIESCFKEVSPGYTFEYKFYDDWFASLYEKEEKQAAGVRIFAIIAIIISCLGLFGLAEFTAKKRIKEIGIRKVNGARISEIMKMLNSGLVTLVSIAMIIAIPISYYVISRWLENFAYKTPLSWWVFAQAGIIALIIALLTVSWQSWKAATRNPVEALRYE